mmetsp:Transcript_43608/g.72448  ORF Transcript_43608/g.72448 Transcript_43608/m.72448 type:complete len:323 (-) Transcript_43608:67-1035(-)
MVRGDDSQTRLLPQKRVKKQGLLHLSLKLKATLIFVLSAGIVVLSSDKNEIYRWYHRRHRCRDCYNKTSNIVIRSWDWLNRQFVSENHHGIDGHNALLSLSTARGHRRAAYTGATMPCDQWERDDNGDDDSDDDEDTSHQQTFISSHTSHQQTFISSHTSSFGEWVEAGMIVIKMSIRSVSEDSPEDAFAACLKEIKLRRRRFLKPSNGSSSSSPSSSSSSLQSLLSSTEQRNYYYQDNDGGARLSFSSVLIIQPPTISMSNSCIGEGERRENVHFKDDRRRRRRRTECSSSSSTLSSSSLYRAESRIILRVAQEVEEEGNQ